MKRKIFIIYIILICLTLKLIYNIVLNNILINRYNNGEYSEVQAKILTVANFPQSYVANYNYGNILYKNAEYEKAIEEYEKALKSTVPQDKECDIRINYALAICKTVQLDEKNEDSIKEAIQIYESAIDILTENGCANRNDNNGHNQKSEQLKMDIQKEIERLEKLQKEENYSSNNNQQQEDKQNQDNTDKIENEIQNMKEEAIKDQREIENKYKKHNKDYSKNEKNW